MILNRFNRRSAAISLSLDSSSFRPLDPFGGLRPFLAWCLLRGLFIAFCISSYLIFKNELSSCGTICCSISCLTFLLSLCSLTASQTKLAKSSWWANIGDNTAALLRYSIIKIIVSSGSVARCPFVMLMKNSSSTARCILSSSATFAICDLKSFKFSIS